MALAFLAFGALAPSGAASAAVPKMAPVNPAFVDWTKKTAAAKERALTTASGRPLGYRPSPLALPREKSVKAFSGRRSTAFPPQYDLRDSDRVTSVKNQGQCGSCWSFAAMGSLESYLMPGQNLDLSENNLKNTHGFEWGCCDGGNALMAMAYLARWDGPVLESADPYDPYGCNSPAGCQVQMHVQNANFYLPRTSPTDNDYIKQALMDHGALLVSMYWDDLAYRSDTHSYYSHGSEDMNHEVCIVGWDDSYPKANFVTEPAGNGAFIVKNSWGAGWGHEGYFYLSYYDNQITGELVSINSSEPVTNYKRSYQYDPLGWTTGVGYQSSYTAWGANIYTAVADEDLTAVSWYNAMPGTIWELSVYTDPTTSPRSGTRVALKSGTAVEAGYATLPLAAGVPLAIGQKFSLVIKLTTPNYGFPLPAEMRFEGWSDGANSNLGESFISDDGVSWIDLPGYPGFEGSNFCIKGFASAALLTDKSAVTITEGSTASFQVKLRAQPASNVTVTVARASGDSDVTVQTGSSLTFTPDNWSTYQTVVLAAAQDSDGTDGSAVVRCSGPGLASKDVVANEADDDKVILTDLNTVRVLEGGTANFQVKLKAQPASDVAVSVVKMGGDTDISVISGSDLTFTPDNWDTYQSVTVAAGQDADTTDGSALIRCSATNYTGKNVTATEMDDEKGISVDVGTVAISEGGTATLQVKLRAVPPATTTVTVSRSSGDSDITIQSGSSLTFTTENWSVNQNVVLAAAEDADVEDGSAEIYFDAGAWGNFTVQANEVDDDRAILTDMDSAVLSEGGQMILQVKLKGQPSEDLQVSVANAEGDSDIAVTWGSSLTFTTQNWDVYQVVVLAAAQDDDSADSTATIRCSADGWTGKDVTITESDDDIGITGVSAGIANGTYTAGDVIPVLVKFSKPVTVTEGAAPPPPMGNAGFSADETYQEASSGFPTLELQVGSATRTAVYDSGSGTDTLVFNYTVEECDYCTDLEYTSPDALSENGGAIEVEIGYTISLTLPEPGEDGSLGANSDIVIQGDGVAPVIGSASSPGIATSSPFTVSYSGVTDNCSLVEVRLWYKKDSGAWTDSGQSAAGSSSSGSFQFAPGDGSGVYSFDLVAEDSTGNVSADPTGTGLTSTLYDTNGPAVAFVEPTSGDIYVTGTTPITISGTASDNVQVSKVTWTCGTHSGTCAGTTSWSAGNIALASGSNVIKVTAYDNVGLTATATLNVTADLDVPTVTITGPTAQEACSRNCNSLTLSGTASDQAGIVGVTWANAAGGSGGCSGTTDWTATGIDLLEGQNAITVTVADLAGHSSTDTITVNYISGISPGSKWRGLSMVSLPLIPDVTDPKLALSLPGNGWVIWDAEEGEYLTYPSTETWFIPRESTPGRGFWARLGTTAVVPCGTIVGQDQNARIRLHRGWNLVGQPFTSTVNWDAGRMRVETAHVSIPLRDATGIVGNYAWGWDSINAKYYLVSPGSTYPGSVAVLQPWESYWVWAGLDCDLIIPPP